MKGKQVKPVREEIVKDLSDLIGGKTHEEAREAIIKSLQEDLITQHLLGESGLTSEQVGLLRSDPCRYMNKQITRVTNPECVNILTWIKPTYSSGHLYGRIMEDWVESLSCDVRIDRLAPPEALRSHGEAAVEQYRQSMSAGGCYALSVGSLWRVVLCPMIIRGVVDNAQAELFGGEIEPAHYLYELFCDAFSGVCIDLDLAAYLAVMNYDRAMRAMKSEDGLLLSNGEQFVSLIQKAPEVEGGLPVMALAMGSK